MGEAPDLAMRREKRSGDPNEEKGERFQRREALNCRGVRIPAVDVIAPRLHTPSNRQDHGKGGWVYPQKAGMTEGRFCAGNHALRAALDNVLDGNPALGHHFGPDRKGAATAESAPPARHKPLN